MNDLLLAPFVILQRLPQLWFEAVHPNPLIGDETRRAINEKIAAFSEGVVGAHVEAYKAIVEMSGAILTGTLPHVRSFDAPQRIAEAAMAPAARRVKANARRLMHR